MSVNCSQNGQLGLHQNQSTIQKNLQLVWGEVYLQVEAYIANPTSPSHR